MYFYFPLCPRLLDQRSGKLEEASGSRSLVKGNAGSAYENDSLHTGLKYLRVRIETTREGVIKRVFIFQAVPKVTEINEFTQSKAEKQL